MAADSICGRLRCPTLKRQCGSGGSVALPLIQFFSRIHQVTPAHERDAFSSPFGGIVRHRQWTRRTLVVELQMQHRNLHTAQLPDLRDRLPCLDPITSFDHCVLLDLAVTRKESTVVDFQGVRSIVKRRWSTRYYSGCNRMNRRADRSVQIAARMRTIAIIAF